MSRCRIVLAAIALMSVETFAAGTMRSTGECREFLKHGTEADVPIEMEGMLIPVYRKQVVILDAEGASPFISRPAEHPPAGSRVRIVGRTRIAPDTRYRTVAVDRYEVLGSGEPPAPIETTVGELGSGPLYYRRVRFRGTVVDAFVDDIDSRWYYLVVKDGAAQTTVTVPVENVSEREIAALLDAECRFTGTVTRSEPGVRRFLLTRIIVPRPEDIAVSSSAAEGPLAVPELADPSELDPEKIPALGRRRITGRVLACWAGDRLVLRTDRGEVVNVRLRKGDGLVEVGTKVMVAGYVETDYYRVNLNYARLWPLPDKAGKSSEDVVPIVPDDILRGGVLRKGILAEFHGRTVRIEGDVLKTEAGELLLIESAGETVRVDASGCPEALEDVLVGSRVAVTGLCFIEVGGRESGDAFPRVRGFSVIARRKGDIMVLKSPSWWTPGRLAVVVGVMFLLLAGLLAWNLIERRISRLRISERTRLAVELHDSVAQNLTGIALQMSTADNLRGTDPEAADECLDAARRMLRSCRTELRRCIWDLRSAALEEHDFASAILLTLNPVLNGAKPVIRFSVPRAAVPDSMAHIVLSMIRELASNAVVHGGARTVRVAGDLDDGKLMFSVSDDGHGLGDLPLPGPDRGHFGIKGIEERAKQYGGTLRLGRSRTGGVRAVVTMELPGRRRNG